MRFTKELVDREALDRAKRHLGGTFSLSLETSDALGYYYGGQEIMRLPLLTPAEYLAKINAVVAEDIRSVARDLFTNDRLNLALIGPFQNRSFLDRVKV